MQLSRTLKALEVMVVEVQVVFVGTKALSLSRAASFPMKPKIQIQHHKSVDIDFHEYCLPLFTEPCKTRCLQVVLALLVFPARRIRITSANT